ncbi:precorrin-3B synthase [Micromonosporaceae bacterium Da 78-11]
MPPPIRQSDVDACPGALRLHAAADGPLARVRLPGGLLTGARLGVLADLAQRWGDGCLELTSRANVQLRALTKADPAGLAARLSGAGLLPSETHETVRNIAAPALAGPRSRALVRRLDAALCADPALAALPGRFLFAIGPVPLDADVAAVAHEDGFAVLLAGADAGLRVPADLVVPALLGAAHGFLAERAGGTAWRLRELTDGPARVAARVAAELGLRPVPVQTVATVQTPDLVGLLPQEDGLISVGATVPLGRLTGVQLKVLEKGGRLVITPARGVLVADLRPTEALAWLRELAAAGLPVEADSRWSGVTACAGRPGCAKSLADVRADADAATMAFVAGLPVHWIGCERGCGSPAGAHVRVEATGRGYLVDGRAVPSTAELGPVVAEARRA